MPYRLQEDQPLADDVLRVLKEQIEDAKHALAKPTGTSIHEARKGIKKARAALRLLSGLLQHDQEQALRSQLREAAGKIAPLRDSVAIGEAVEDLATNSHLNGAVLKHTDQGAKKFGRQAAASAKASVRDAVRILGEVAGALQNLNEPGNKSGSIHQNLERTIKRGRKAMKRARQSDDVVAFHDWRKRVKEHWYQTRLLAGVNGFKSGKREEKLNELETLLGEDHNLFALRDAVRLAPGEAATLNDGINARSRELRRKALKLGRKLF